LLLQIPIFWYVTVNQQQREGSALAKVLFKDELAQGQAIAQITGRQMNPDKVIDEFEYRWQVKDLFMKGEPAQPAPGQSEVGQQDMNDLNKRLNLQERSLAGSQLTESQRGMAQRPALSELMKG
jgi:hypothetical protein